MIGMAANMLPDEIIKHTREELRRWLLAHGNDVAEHEVDAVVDRMIVQALAQQLSSAMICASLASHYFDDAFKERAERQLWNW